METSKQNFTCDSCGCETTVDWSKIRPITPEHANCNIVLYEDTDGVYTYYGVCSNCGSLKRIQLPETDLHIEQVNVKPEGIECDIIDNVTNRECCILLRLVVNDGWDYTFEMKNGVDEEDNTISDAFIKELNANIEELNPLLTKVIDEHEKEYNKLISSTIKEETLSKAWKDKLGENLFQLPEDEFRAFRYAEMKNISTYDIKDNIMTYIKENKEHKVNLNTLTEIEEENKKIEEEVTANNNTTAIANWIKDTVEDLKEDEAGCGTWKLDDRLAICVGWSDGYDANDTDDNYIHSKDDPKYCIEASIKVWTSDDMRTDLDWINFPYDDENTYDDSYTISKNEDYNELAKSLLHVYSTYKDCEIDKDGKITSRPSEDNVKNYTFVIYLDSEEDITNIDDVIDINSSAYAMTFTDIKINNDEDEGTVKIEGKLSINDTENVLSQDDVTDELQSMITDDNLISVTVNADESITESKDIKEEASSTEEYWDATEIDRDGFIALLKFNFGTDANHNNYIVTVDGNEVKRFYAENEEEAKSKYQTFKNEFENSDHGGLTMNVKSIAPREESKEIPNKPTEQQRDDIYNEVSRVLTDYENGDATTDDLYDTLVKVQNNWEGTITANLEESKKVTEGKEEIIQKYLNRIKDLNGYNDKTLKSELDKVLKELDTDKALDDTDRKFMYDKFINTMLDNYGYKKKTVEENKSEIQEAVEGQPTNEMIENVAHAIAENKDAGIYQRFIAHIIESLATTLDNTQSDITVTDVKELISDLVDEDELWDPVDDYIVDALKKLKNKDKKTEDVSDEEEINLEPIVSSINADSCKVNGDIVTGSAELVQYDGSEYNPVSDEFTFEYNRKDKTIKVTSDNKAEIVKDLDEEEIINNLEDNILPEIITEAKLDEEDDKADNKPSEEYYYEIHFDYTEDTGKDSDGYSVFFKSNKEVEDYEDIINLATELGALNEDDLADIDYIDYAQQLDKEEYNDATLIIEGKKVINEVKKVADMDDVDIIMLIEEDVLPISDVADWNRVKALALDLSKSKGYYGRLYRNMINLENEYGGAENLPLPMDM